jgi:hypothetical protein
MSRNRKVFRRLSGIPTLRERRLLRGAGGSCHAAPCHERQHLVFAARDDFAFPDPQQNLPTHSDF